MIDPCISLRCVRVVSMCRMVAVVDRCSIEPARQLAHTPSIGASIGAVSRHADADPRVHAVARARTATRARDRRARRSGDRHRADLLVLETTAGSGSPRLTGLVVRIAGAIVPVLAKLEPRFGLFDRPRSPNSFISSSGSGIHAVLGFLRLALLDPDVLVGLHDEPCDRHGFLVPLEVVLPRLVGEPHSSSVFVLVLVVARIPRPLRRAASRADRSRSGSGPRACCRRSCARARRRARRELLDDRRARIASERDVERAAHHVRPAPRCRDAASRLGLAEREELCGGLRDLDQRDRRAPARARSRA